MQRKSTFINFILVFLVLPLFLGLSLFLPQERRTYIISIIIVIFSVVFFFIKFEMRKPKAREIVLISVLCAITVAGRAAFFMVPQFKPMAAIIIISGIALGAETGFLVGSLSAFISNFLFGQGPWTPWQMFCFGIIGFLAGIIFNNLKIKRKNTFICIYGVLAVFILYGGILNPMSVLIFTGEFSLSAIASSYVAGFYFDLIHAIATAIFLYILSNPLIKKIERVQKKYGM